MMISLESCKRLRSDLQDPDVRRMIALPFTLPWHLAGYFKDRLSLRQADEEIKHALNTREDRFLYLVKTQIYDRPGSAYDRLMKHAGCLFGDLYDFTRRHGLDAVLRKLAEEGVYLTAAEFKGKKDVVRGALSFRITPRDVALSRSGPGMVSQSSGTSNRPIRSFSSLDWLKRDAATVGVFVSAHGLETHLHATYEPVLPGVGGIMFMLLLGRLGIPCERWFARSVPFNNRLEQAYALLLAQEVSLVGSQWGPGFARPEATAPQDLGRIVHWISRMKQKGRNTCIRTVASSAVRIAKTAADMGVLLNGVTFISTGEPMTEAKYRVITQVEAKTTVAYGYDPGTIHVGFGCANPSRMDDMHVNQNTLGVVPHPSPINHDGREIHPLLFTTLYPSAAVLLLNVENGDYANLQENDCGCRMHSIGLRLRIHHVRSYEKFTSEGLSYPIWDLMHLMEERLPAEFGGGVGDYQLLEEQAESGQTHLTLLVHPQVGTIDEKLVITRLQEEMSRGHRGNRFMTRVWKNAGTFRVRREAPFESARGKVLPLRLAVGDS